MAKARDLKTSHGLSVSGSTPSTPSRLGHIPTKDLAILLEPRYRVPRPLEGILGNRSVLPRLSTSHGTRPIADRFAPLPFATPASHRRILSGRAELPRARRSQLFSSHTWLGFVLGAPEEPTQ